MKKFAKSVVEFLKEEDGPTAVEYAVMLALIIVVCLGTITQLGTAVEENFETVTTAL
ncbi:Flp/Fap pilin component [Stieleria bergensis]|uniref:Flp/Fap pilin component n=1 Tax=Stieleria bergensis TaxID=2528025 RepID=A0A517SNQ7_9BACT|nr:MAG: Flp family type IVb pilin [Rhodopirellula sp. TMED11]QDT57760.1 Flp/Fap pilin component [Planctomycetes bacterium SV_7m_r]